ncbi:MAG: superinfection immunity protein, partial [Pseudonocardia sp.]|nr:superinfection immunity protein [Pseudonocardia sp.]
MLLTDYRRCPTTSPDIGSVIVINLLLGWTFVGWVVSMAMAS